MSCYSFCGLIGVLYLLFGISNVNYDRFYATIPVLTDCSNIQNNQMCECPSNNITGQTDKGNKDNSQLTMMNDTKSETQSEEKETSKDMDVKKRTLPVNESKECAPGSDPNQEKARPGVPENSSPTTISNLEYEKPEETESLQPNLSNEFIAVWMLGLVSLGIFCGWYVRRKADNGAAYR